MVSKVKVSASEIGDYVYCMNHWWKIVQGSDREITQGMLDGISGHESLFTNVKFTKVLLYLSLFIISLGVLILLTFYFFQ